MYKKKKNADIKHRKAKIRKKNKIRASLKLAKTKTA